MFIMLQIDVFIILLYGKAALSLEIVAVVINKSFINKQTK